MRSDQVNAAKFAVCAALILTLTLLASPTHADELGQARAKKMLDDQKTTIGRFMHPTSSLDKIVCTKSKTYETGEFYLIYSFYFDNDKYQSALRFKFFEDGSLDAIEVAGTSTWIKPFQAADLVLNAVVHLIPLPIADRVTALLKEGATRTALEFWLRSRA